MIFRQFSISVVIGSSQIRPYIEINAYGGPIKSDAITVETQVGLVIRGGYVPRISREYQNRKNNEGPLFCPLNDIFAIKRAKP